MSTWQQEQDEDESFWRRRGPLIGGLGLLLVFGLVGWFALRGLGGAGPPEPPAVQEISLVQPPPPPPPPKLEEPPPPEEQVELPEPEPEPEPVADDAEADEPPPGEDLGLDADGVAGSDGFGLRARKGGRGLIGGGDRNRWYVGVIQRDLQDLLASSDDARAARYAVTVKLWIATDGGVERFELTDSTGNEEADRALRTLLSGLRFDDPPPADMPQPLKWRLSAR